jgi:hypothetical protein
VKNEDYELWEAMMADEPSTPTPTIVAPPAPATPALPVLELPEVIEEPIEEEEEIEFASTIFKEPQTNSIQFTEIPDALNDEIFTGSGEVLKTGAIDIPILNNTGSIPIITNTHEEIDESAIIADMGDETTGGIPPIRSGSVVNSSAKVGVLPIKNRRSESQTILLATTSILLVTLGALVIAASMFKLI